MWSVAKRQRTNRLQPEGDIIEVVEVDKGKSLAGETSSAPVWAPPFLKPDRTPITKVDSLLESLELALLLLGAALPKDMEELPLSRSETSIAFYHFLVKVCLIIFFGRYIVQFQANLPFLQAG